MINNCPASATGAECEFCLEFSEACSSRFGLTYGDVTESRIIAEQDGIVVLPTLGQLFVGSLLIMPRDHFETVAEIPERLLDGCFRLVAEFSERLRAFGTSVVFEHGARSETERSCGIYHAHLHLVPVPAEISVEDALPNAGTEASTLEDAYDVLRDEDAYLLFRDTRKRTKYVIGAEAHSEIFRSQYFRKMLAAHFRLPSPWDWRAYQGIESRVLNTLGALQSHVAVR